MSKKLITISERKRPKGRDLYDVTYLWGMTELDEKYLSIVSNQSLQQVLSKLSNYIQSLNLKNLATEVSPFLTNLEDQARVLHFDHFIESKINAS
ncbi:MAG: hypothetical protein Fur0011_2930 [Candidatus Microgenomates bacterium]